MVESSAWVTKGCCDDCSVIMFVRSAADTVAKSSQSVKLVSVDVVCVWWVCAYRSLVVQCTRQSSISTQVSRRRLLCHTTVNHSIISIRPITNPLNTLAPLMPAVLQYFSIYTCLTNCHVHRRQFPPEPCVQT